MSGVRQDLVAAARGGDSTALGQLLVVCQPDLKRFARRKCSSVEDAEDAVQLALWQLYQKIGALRTAATFATWLFRIVERECYRLFHHRSTSGSLDDVPEDRLECEHVPADLRIDLCRAIASLTPPYREVLIMCDIDEMSAAEVAAQLSIRVEAVKSRLHRARSNLRKQLTASGYWSTEWSPSPASAGNHGHSL